MKKHIGSTVFVALGGAAVAAMAPPPNLEFGNDTTAYTYDALGRLTASSISGGPNNGRQTGTCFDPAGNRLRYDVATSTPGSCSTSTPTPSPTPTPSNSPPVAAADTQSVLCNATTDVDLTSNDSDPEGNFPLSLVSITWFSGGDASASIVSSSAVSVTGDTTHSATVFSYIVQDSLGAQSEGTLTVNSVGSSVFCE